MKRYHLLLALLCTFLSSMAYAAFTVQSSSCRLPGAYGPNRCTIQYAWTKPSNPTWYCLWATTADGVTRLSTCQGYANYSGTYEYGYESNTTLTLKGHSTLPDGSSFGAGSFVSSAVVNAAPPSGTLVVAGSPCTLPGPTAPDRCNVSYSWTKSNDPAWFCLWITLEDGSHALSDCQGLTSHSGIFPWVVQNPRVLTLKAHYYLPSLSSDFDAGYSVQSVPVWALTASTPSISTDITMPTSGTNFAAPATINITATASITSGSIASVQLFRNGTLIDTSWSAPYQYIDSNLPAGNYSYFVRACDNAATSHCKNSSAVTFLVNPAAQPTVSVQLLSPTSGATFLAPANINLSAAASTSIGWISFVQFYRDGNLIGTNNIAPYPYTDSAVTAGNHSYYARACDGASPANCSYSATSTIVVNNPATPVVSAQLTSPASSLTLFAPANLSLSANASVSIGNIQFVEFYSNNTLINTDFSEPYQFNDSNIPQGTYSYRVRACDSAQPTNCAFSQASVVTVNPPNDCDLIISPGTSIASTFGSTGKSIQIQKGGRVVCLSPGTYNETIPINISTSGNTLKSLDINDQAIIISSAARGIEVVTSNTIIRDLKISGINASQTVFGVLTYQAQSTKLINIEVTRALIGIGINTSNGTEITDSKVLFAGDGIAGRADPSVWNSGSNQTVISGSSFKNNGVGPAGDGEVACYNSSGFEIRNSTVEDSGASAIYVVNCDGARLIGNTVLRPKEWGLDIARHVSCPPGDPCSGTDNVFAEGNLVRNASRGGAVVFKSNNPTFINNIYDNNYIQGSARCNGVNTRDVLGTVVQQGDQSLGYPIGSSAGRLQCSY
jgi:hypothetical protein